MADEYQWHLDGWDRRAGRAFASRRSRGADLAENQSSWGPTVYIGPPDFRPEQIGSTAIALSASRAAYFAESVPTDANSQNELSFPSAAAAAEFVRLAFVASGRNRGGGEGGSPPTDRSPPGAPEGEEIPQDSLWYYLSEAQTRRKDLKPGGDATALPLSSFDQVFAAGVREEAIESGALQLVVTALDAKRLGMLDATWPHACTTLHRALAELQLWPEWLQRPGKDKRTLRNARYLWDSVSATLQWPGDFKIDDHNATSVIVAAAFLCASPFPTLSESRRDYVRHLLTNWGHDSDYLTYSAFGLPADSFDRFAPLFNWPVPRYIADRDETISSVGSLLMAFIAAPQKVVAWSGASDIVCFAAALLASRVEERKSFRWRGRAASHWLATSVPTHVFAEPIEALIWEPEPVHELAGAAG